MTLSAPSTPMTLRNRLADHFRKELRMLVAEFGQSAIDAALGNLPRANRLIDQ